jgi:death-on-curing protein
MARPLSLDEAEYIAHALAVELMNYIDEPIPPFNTRGPNILESCLLEPFQTFDGKELHHTLANKAALLFYLVIKNHPFSNGNKRMAVVLTGVFCIVNKKALAIPPKSLYDIACEIAKSDPKDKDVHLKVLDETFMKYMKPISFIRRIK